jgi:hypothetical protein
MGTRGFVGYKKDGKIKGFYNNNDSYYSYLGSKVLVKFGAYSNKEIEDFFTKRLELIENDVKDKFYENHREIWGIDWSTDSIKLQDGTGFLLDSLICEFGYVFNLDKGIVEVYRGFFLKPQAGKEKIEYEMKKIFTKNDKEYFTHLVCTINRNELEIAHKMFDCDSEIEDNNSDEYPEKIFMEREKQLKKV